MKENTYKIPHVALRMVRERTLTVTRTKLTCGSDLAALVTPIIGNRPVEFLVAVLVSGTGEVTGITTLAQGGMHGVGVTARDVLRAVLAGHASAFALAHNHPSGDPRPSPDDVTFTARIGAAADIIGIPLLDHVVVTADSFATVTP